jgi:hypothetical protein
LPSLLFSGGLLGNGSDGGVCASAHTDESNSLGLSNCSKIVESPFAVKKGEKVENSYIPWKALMTKTKDYFLKRIRLDLNT